MRRCGSRAGYWLVASLMAANVLPLHAAPAECAQPFTPAYAIRGAAATPPSGTLTIQGVVVGDFEGPRPALRGFYVQDPRGDGNPATSDAIFVFNGDRDSVRPGEVVRVHGRIGAYHGRAQLTALEIQTCGSGSVEPVALRLPLPQPDAPARLEGMLVRLPQTLYVTGSHGLARFGEVVLALGAHQAQPTAVVAPGAPARAMRQRNALGRIILDDVDNAWNPAPIVFGRGGQAWSAINPLRAGDSVSEVVGVLTPAPPGAQGWRLRPFGALGGGAPDFRPANPRPAAAPSVGGDLRVAGMNLRNYFNTFGSKSCAGGVEGVPRECRGARDADTFQRQSARIVAALRGLDADIVAVAELENDGYGPASAISHLVSALNAASAPGSYVFVDADAASGQRNALGNDAVKVGLLYKPARLALVGRTAVLNSAAFVNGGDDLPRNRPALAQTFQTNSGKRLIVVANHFKSKAGECNESDAQDGQGACNLVRARAAQQLRKWLGDDPTATGGHRILILGDLNAYAREDPLRVLTARGWVDLAARFGGPHAYSHVFDGEWGYLDHALASPALAGRVTGAAYWHINADESEVPDGRVGIAQRGLAHAVAEPFRSSDHDPLLVGLRLDAR